MKHFRANYATIERSRAMLGSLVHLTRVARDDGKTIGA
jgi:hypothetical protein